MDAGALRPLRLVRARPGDAAAVLGPLRLVLAAGAVPHCIWAHGAAACPGGSESTSSNCTLGFLVHVKFPCLMVISRQLPMSLNQ